MSSSDLDGGQKQRKVDRGKAHKIFSVIINLVPGDLLFCTFFNPTLIKQSFIKTKLHAGMLVQAEGK